MRKDIYIIRNRINNKVYIGQAINTQQRFNSHISRAKTNSDNSPIHDAINKIGKEAFYYEILESQIENYNEREKYWIKYYNSIVPNGYNLLEGGNEPPYSSGEDCWNASITNEIAQKIINDLKNTSLKMKEIAKKYNINYSTIRHINYGEGWVDINEHYPLRKNDERTVINELQLDDVIWLLSVSTCSMQQIGDYFGVGRKTIERINKGITHYNENYQYPLRKVRHKSTESVEEALIRRGK